MQDTPRAKINLAPLFMIICIFCFGGYIAVVRSLEAALFLTGCAFALLALFAGAQE